MNEVIDLDATGRFGLDEAPNAMRLIQDLVNTRPPVGARAPDLLQDAPTANAWLQVALKTWSERSGQPLQALSLLGRDLPALRRFRAQLQAWLADRSVALTIREHLLAVSLREGQPAYRANQSGSEGIIALVCMEMLLDSRTDGAPRLKVCANPSCGAAFHDNSRNLSRVWHDVKTCGNQANLRASRARKRESQEG